MCVEEGAPGGHEPAQHEFGSHAPLVDFGMQMQIALLALETNGKVLLVYAIKLQKGRLVEHLPHVLNAEGVDDIVEIVLLESFEVDVHVTVLADRLDLLTLHAGHDPLEVEVLFGQRVPVGEDGAGDRKDEFALDHEVGCLGDSGVPGLGAVEPPLELLALEVELLALEAALVLLVLGDELGVLFEVLPAEDAVQVVDYPVFVLVHEVFLHALQLQVLLLLLCLQVLLHLDQLLPHAFASLLLVDLQPQGHHADQDRQDFAETPHGGQHDQADWV